MNFNIQLERRQYGMIAGALLVVYAYFFWIVGPNGERLSELSDHAEKQRKQLEQLRSTRAKQAEIDLLIGSADASQSIEARVEQVGRELNVQPQIRKIGDSSASEANRVQVQLGGLYLRELISFLRKIEAFPVTIQVVKIEITKQQNLAGVVLVLSDLNL